MKFFRNPEVRGISVLILIILVLGGLFAVVTGKTEQWFGLDWFTGPKLENKIVFVSERSGGREIFSMDLDGSNQKKLTSGARVSSTLAISTAGNRIAFVGMEGKSEQILSVGARGGDTEQLTSATGPKSAPAYSPNGKAFSFIAGGKVYVAELDGSKPDPVLPTHEELHTAMVARGALPAYSDYLWDSNGSSMLGVTKDSNDSDNLAFMPKPEGEAFKFLAITPGPNSIPQLAFLQDFSKKPVSYSLEPGDDKIRVTGIAGAASAPIYVASTNIGKLSLLWLINIREGTMGPIPAPGVQEFGKPAISPDGSEIMVPVISRSAKAPSGLVRLPLSSESGGPQMVSVGEFRDIVYSPKGDEVLAVKVDAKSKKCNIIKISLTDGKIRQLTKDGCSYSPAWSPIPKSMNEPMQEHDAHDHDTH